MGRHGTTVKDIESDYPGVKLIVVDPGEFVEIHGDEKAVHRALERVKDVFGFSVCKRRRRNCPHRSLARRCR